MLETFVWVSCLGVLLLNVNSLACLLTYLFMYLLTWWQLCYCDRWICQFSSTLIQISAMIHEWKGSALLLCPIRSLKQRRDRILCCQTISNHTHNDRVLLTLNVVINSCSNAECMFTAGFNDLLLKLIFFITGLLDFVDSCFCPNTLTLVYIKKVPFISSCLYTVSKKTPTQTFVHIFANYWPIFKKFLHCYIQK